ncbi:MAG: hypothetical protein K2N86_05790, partial [Rikenellaceae bacterium]|nr:hypothetical protein [Rikenellaceae bacterium]MDE7355297.1 hypothetical protein [Rikenellaceae bacterium]
NYLAGLRASAGGGSARCGSYLAALPGQKPAGAKAMRRKNLPVQKLPVPKAPQKPAGPKACRCKPVESKNTRAKASRLNKSVRFRYSQTALPGVKLCETKFPKQKTPNLKTMPPN